jgi:hypothetical protein
MRFACVRIRTNSSCISTCKSRDRSVQSARTSGRFFLLLLIEPGSTTTHQRGVAFRVLARAGCRRL